MRKIALLLAIGLTGFATYAQDKKASDIQAHIAPYLEHKQMPAMEILDINDKDTFNTYNIKPGRPTLIIYFGPDCDHCKQMLEGFKPDMDKLKDIDIYMVSFAPTIAIRIYNSVNHWENYSNVKMLGQDFRFFFPGFYGVSSVPNLVLYDKKKNFVKLWTGGASIREILEANK